MPADQTVDFVIMFLVVGLVSLGLLSMVVGWAVRVWDRIVNRSQIVMSRSEGDDPETAPSSLQTDSRQTADRPMIPVPTPEKTLDIFRVLRAAGIKRETISAPWRAAGLPFDNNLWTQAAPPEKPVSMTPIAGRPTSAEFHDPDLIYQPPPR